MELCPKGNACLGVSARSPCCARAGLELRARLQVKCSAQKVIRLTRFLGECGSLPASARFPGIPAPSFIRHCEGATFPGSSRAALAMPPTERNPQDDPRLAPGVPERDEPNDPYRTLLNEHLTRSVNTSTINTSTENTSTENASIVNTGTEDSSTVNQVGKFGDSVGSSSEKRQGTPTLVLMRHGESMWNDLKLFTGDVDIPLTEKGVMEAMAGGRSVAEIDFNVIFTSRLMRSKQTALLSMTQNIHKGVPVIIRGGYHGNGQTGDANRLRLRAAAAQALDQAECRMIPVYADPALNERCYGDLQGLNKEAAEKTFGQELVAKWRRSHDTRPPKGESLKDTWHRTLGFYMSTVEPLLGEGKNVLVVAHGNVLRCIISYLCHLTEEEMLRLQIATALPYAFSYNDKTYAQCCVLPAVNPETGLPIYGRPMGLTSAIRKGAVDSLI